MAIFNGMRQKMRGGSNAGRGDQPYQSFAPRLPGGPSFGPTQRNSGPGTMPRLPFTPSSNSGPQPATFNAGILKKAENAYSFHTNEARNIKLPEFSGDTSKIANTEVRDDFSKVRTHVEGAEKAKKVRDEQVGLQKQEAKQNVKSKMAADKASFMKNRGL